jgi:hypothetical protein
MHFPQGTQYGTQAAAMLQRGTVRRSKVDMSNWSSLPFPPYGMMKPRWGAGTATPTAADAPTLDELLAKISAMALDLLPDNHPDIDPASLFLQITALGEAEPAVA